MKHLLFILLLAYSSAFAQTNTTEWHMFGPDGKDRGGAWPTQALCQAAARLIAAPDNSKAFYPCVQGITRTGKVVAPPVVIPPVVIPPVVVPPVVPPLGTPPAGSLIPFVDVKKMPPAQVGWAVPMVRPYVGNQPASPNAPDGDFREACFFSHMIFDDPMVYPNQPGVSHLHANFGNTAMNAALTSADILKVGNSTCAGGKLNSTAYWTSVVIDSTDGTPIVPSALLAYYKTASYEGVTAESIQPVPTGLRMISGNSAAKTEAESSNVRFACVGGDKGVGWQKSIPTNCYQDNLLIMEVGFARCWDGKNLDSPDHKSHMHETVDNKGCPASHPVVLPQISYEVYLDLSKVDLKRMAKWRLSSDNYSAALPAGYSFHGDYMMGWDPATMKQIIEGCTHAKMDCHVGNLGNGTELWMQDMTPQLKALSGAR
jgi:hypothetical protein